MHCVRSGNDANNGFSICTKPTLLFGEEPKGILRNLIPSLPNIFNGGKKKEKEEAAWLFTLSSLSVVCIPFQVGIWEETSKYECSTNAFFPKLTTLLDTY